MATQAMPGIANASPSTMQLPHTESSQHQLQTVLQTLPDKVSHPIMVPFGSVAFFPGRLIHTNECMVDLGGDTMVEMSAKETVQLLQARQNPAGSPTQVEAVEQPETDPDQAPPQPASPLQQAQQPAASVDDQILEIMEEYDEAIHGPLQKALPEDNAHAPPSMAKPVLPVHAPSNAASDLTQQASQTVAVTTIQQQSQQPSQTSSVLQLASSSRQARPAAKASQATSPSGQSPHIRGIQQQESAQQQHVQELQQQQQVRRQQHKQQAHQQLQQRSQQAEHAQQAQHAQHAQPAQQQQACAQDDGEFECMMARFDELERQEAAAPSGEAAVTATANAEPTSAPAGGSGNPAAAASVPPPESKMSRGSAKTALPAAEQPVRETKAAKPSSGLRRGFFSKPLKANTVALATPPVPDSSSLKASQTGNNMQSEVKAFTGKIVEHADVPEQSSAGMASSSTCMSSSQNAAEPQKRVSRFKQSRHAQHN